MAATSNTVAKKKNKKKDKRRPAKGRSEPKGKSKPKAKQKPKGKDKHKSEGKRKSKGKGKHRQKTAKKPKPRFTARTADKHDLYQRSVQAPDLDAGFFSDYFKDYTGRDLRMFREDFCGTFILSTEFVKLHPDNQAVCVDLDGPTLDWGREHNLAKLNEEQQGRVHILQRNVLDVAEPKADLIAAMNFSYCILKERDQLQAYLANCHRSLAPGGVMIMDMWGGSETQVLQEEDRDIEGGFTYTWDQNDFDPLSYNSICKIHFEFEDGSKLRNAFIYDWRLWTPPDLAEAMQAAGFDDIHFLWDTEDDDDENKYERVSRGEADDAWIAYIVGKKS